MQKHPRESDDRTLQRSPATTSAFQKEMGFVSNSEQARKYAGQWVALDGDQVVAAGHHPKEVLAEAGKRGQEDPVLHYFPLRDPDTVFLGGWS